MRTSEIIGAQRLDINSVRKSMNNLGSPKKCQTHYEYRDFDPSTYIGNIEEALTMKSPYIDSRRTSIGTETAYEESLMSGNESLLSFEHKSQVIDLPVKEVDIAQDLPVESSSGVIDRGTAEVASKENHVQEGEKDEYQKLPDTKFFAEMSMEKEFLCVESPVYPVYQPELIPPVVNGFYSKEALVPEPFKFEIEENELHEKKKSRKKEKRAESKKKLHKEKIGIIKIRPLEKRIVEDGRSVSSHTSREEPTCPKEQSVVERTCFGLEVSDEDDDMVRVFI